MSSKNRKLVYSLAIIIACLIIYVVVAETMRRHRTEDSRQRLGFQFTASSSTVVFPVPLGEEATGLAIIDRVGGSKRLIFEDNTISVYPHLSADGNRLLFVRRRIGENDRQLISCALATWTCRVLLRTAQTIFSPWEVESDKVLVSSSPPVVGIDGRERYSNHDFYLIEQGSQPKQLSDFRFYQLSSLGVFNSKIIFSAMGPPREDPLIPKFEPLATSSSEIYLLDFDRETGRIHRPQGMLSPIFPIEGFSTQASASFDGKQIAFLNRRNSEGRSRFNLAIAKLAGTVEMYIEASAFGFSRPTFVERYVLANELLSDRYQIKVFDPSNRSSEVIAELEYASGALTKMSRIDLRIVQ